MTTVTPATPGTPAVPATRGTLEVPGARLHHEIRGSGPLVALVAAPMGADAFAPLADLLAADHTVLTADPRGIGRSTVTDPDADITPEIRADDVARLITHVDAGPAAQGLGDPQAAADNDVQFRRMLRPTTAFVPDVDALRSGPTRVVVGVGERSGGEICDRTSRALAAALGTGPALFPGGHIGFADDPAAFATRLRAVLAGFVGHR